MRSSSAARPARRGTRDARPRRRRTPTPRRDDRQPRARRGGQYPSAVVTVRIVTDSACDLPQAVADELGIEIVPLTIRIGGEEFVDRRDLTPAEFWARCAASPDAARDRRAVARASSKRPTAARRRRARPAIVVDLAQRRAVGDDAERRARRPRRRRRDPRHRRRQQLRDARPRHHRRRSARAAPRTARRPDEVAARARDLAARTRVWGALDTLENLKKGGRIGGAKALLASALSIKPIVEVRNGKVEQGGKQRTRSARRSRSWSTS